MSSSRLRKRAHDIDDNDYDNDDIASKRRRVLLEPASDLHSSAFKRQDVYDIPNSPELLDTAPQPQSQTFSRLRPLANFSVERDELQRQLEVALQELEASQQHLSIAQEEASQANSQILLLHRQLGQSQSQLMVAREDLLRHSQCSFQLADNPPYARQSTQPTDSTRFPQRSFHHRIEDHSYVQRATDAPPRKSPGRPRKQSLAPPSRPRGRPRKQSHSPAPAPCPRPRGRPRKSLAPETKTWTRVATSSPLAISKRPTHHSTGVVAQSAPTREQRLDKELARGLPRSVSEDQNALLKDDSKLGSRENNDSDDQGEDHSEDPSQGEEEDAIQPAASAHAPLDLAPETAVVAPEINGTVNRRITSSVLKDSVPASIEEIPDTNYEMNNHTDEDNEEDDSKVAILVDFSHSYAASHSSGCG